MKITEVQVYIFLRINFPPPFRERGKIIFWRYQMGGGMNIDIKRPIFSSFFIVFNAFTHKLILLPLCANIHNLGGDGWVMVIRKNIHPCFKPTWYSWLVSPSRPDDPNQQTSLRSPLNQAQLRPESNFIRFYKNKNVLNDTKHALPRTWGTWVNLVGLENLFDQFTDLVFPQQREAKL